MTKDRGRGGRRRVSGDRSGGRCGTWFVLKDVVGSHAYGQSWSG